MLTRIGNYWVFVACLLSTSCLSCYWYYSSTRSHSVSSITNVLPDVASSCCSFPQAPSIFSPDAKFLSYLPHSGLHNQRIALENALILGKLTNRTVLVPPLRLGSNPIRYVSSDKLQIILALAEKTGLRHCPKLRSSFIPPECLDQDSFTHVSPAWLFNLSSWDVIYLDKLSPSAMNLDTTDILDFHDTHPYQYRFLDTNRDLATLKHKYDEVVYIPDLANSSHKLLQLGSLFGSSRLRLRLKENKRIRTKVRRSMAFASPELLAVASDIHKSMGGYYFGAHIRVGDGEFQEKRDQTIQQVHQKLTNELLERNTTWQHSSRCHGPALYISTDVPNAATDPLFATLRQSFPCTYFLSDFAAHHLAGMRNTYDGLAMWPFLVPLVDAMVVGRAEVVVGTENSTFSQFIEDVLWRVHRGLGIAERG
ncbi:SAM domain-containing protein [Mycena indigotica]|uniref:SAM domain-containing protein n=1 Tax=Mycena indigotica TaxID=2126181 RepID=A0A8H6RYW5_9AGAR|nr:SAM domain-containing protein [Mycena indigotica]KAF7289223.1 SAM domain-containing protein [Mycena indigotica]